MCGIIGYIGYRKASEVILEGLRKLEYRGYDSAGIATLSGKIQLIKDAGRLDEIHRRRNFLQLEGTIGIGHTRWATHGGVSQKNAHPHSDSHGKIFLVHNGVIENFEELRASLSKKGHRFSSETDTEAIAHLVEEELKKEKDFGKAFSNAISMLKGTWSVVCISEGEEAIHASRNGPPLVIGIGEGEMFCASDVPALLAYTKKVVFLEDGDRAVIKKGGFEIFSGSKRVRRKIHSINWSAQMAEKGGYPHFMLKEISEQPAKIREALSADVDEAAAILGGQEHFTVVACGSSYYAGLVFKSIAQSILGVPCEVILGSEFQYARTGKEKVVIAISQSGETADTLSAARLAKSSGAKVVAITNVLGSSLYREADASVMIGAGPELSVVATKSFTCQVAVLAKIALALGKREKELERLQGVSEKIEKVLESQSKIKKLADRLSRFKDFFYIGRGMAFPSALEGALKLKEITYLHAEAYAAGELKHGPLSLLDKNVVVVALAPADSSFPKTMSNVQECLARNANLVVLSDSKQALGKAKLSLAVPKAEGAEIPLVYSVPLQLLAYYLAVKLKRDPDKPRNLAKSVTVE
ncbi:MAG: glutamine--fructose-6-phosphate transaminase (isomerizing) [Candidatus Micrarchaeota archaeon]|nr:glutamine--fructose-6-phosphate transaminase (isomerizing) [Candidatus Micrarchaeota archaeon]